MVYAWTLDTTIDIDSFLKLNTDGMITDSPGAVREIVESASVSTCARRMAILLLESCARKHRASLMCRIATPAANDATRDAHAVR